MQDTKPQTKTQEADTPLGAGPRELRRIHDAVARQLVGDAIDRIEAMSAYRSFVSETGDIPEDYIREYIKAKYEVMSR